MLLCSHSDCQAGFSSWGCFAALSSGAEIFSQLPAVAQTVSFLHLHCFSSQWKDDVCALHSSGCPFCFRFSYSVQNKVQMFPP